jgi:hypothetical protein
MVMASLLEVWSSAGLEPVTLRDQLRVLPTVKANEKVPDRCGIRDDHVFASVAEGRLVWCNHDVYNPDEFLGRYS